MVFSHANGRPWSLRSAQAAERHGILREEVQWIGLGPGQGATSSE